MSFVKLHDCLLRSSVWGESKDVKILWITLLVLADADGIVEASVPGLARLAALTLQETEAAIAALEAPDPYSRTPDDDGRRIEKIAGGWHITNYRKYREARDEEARKEQLREAAEKRRARELEAFKQRRGVVTTDLERSYEVTTGYYYEILLRDSVVGDKIQIGFSKNPWARLKELEMNHDASFLQCTRATKAQFIMIQNALAKFMNRERAILFTPENLNLLGENRTRFLTVNSTTTEASTTYAQAEAEAEAEEVVFSNENTTKHAGAVLDVASSDGDDEDLRTLRELESQEASDGGSEQESLGLKSEDETNKAFPWPGVMAIFKRIAPHLAQGKQHGPRRDAAMKRFWRQHGKSLAAFETLATKVAESDYLMARNGHTGMGGKPFGLAWVFSRNDKGEERAEKILADGYSTDAMAFVLERAKEAKLTRAWNVGQNQAQDVNLEEVHAGSKRWMVSGTTHIASNLPEVIDLKS